MRSGFLLVVGIAVSNPLLFFVAIVVNSSVILTTARSGAFSMVRRRTSSSPQPSKWGGTPSADPGSATPGAGAATAAAAIASPLFTDRCLSRGKPETNTALDAAVSARKRLTIRLIRCRQSCRASCASYAATRDLPAGIASPTVPRPKDSHG